MRLVQLLPTLVPGDAVSNDARALKECLKELDVRAKLGINIIAIKRNGKINTFPAGDYRFVDGDVIVVLGDESTMKRVQKL